MDPAEEPELLSQAKSGPWCGDRIEIGARLLIVAGIILMGGAVLWPVIEAVFYRTF